MSLYHTLQANGGGATIDPLTFEPLQFSKGYAVALTDNAFERLTVKATEANRRKLEAYAKSLNLRRYYFGYWRDSKTGRNFFDLSVILDKKSEAVSFGRLFNQKAIFDFRNMASVYITA